MHLPSFGSQVIRQFFQRGIWSLASFQACRFQQVQTNCAHANCEVQLGLGFQFQKEYRKIFLLSQLNSEILSVYPDAEEGHSARASKTRED